MDDVTFTAFRQLWNLYREYQNIKPGDSASWDFLVNRACQIIDNASAAVDQDFITDFGIAVLASLDRISARNN